MAKLRAPLLSLGASGAIGKAMVFFGWKGVDVVREYVIPSNPKSTRQVAIRTYFKSAVDYIHAQQRLPSSPLDEDDQIAYATLGSLQPTPRTWFNTIVKHMVYNTWRLLYATIFRNGSTAPGDGQLVVTIYSSDLDVGKIEAGNFHYGTSKSNLINTWPAGFTPVAKLADAVITGLANGVKYYWQFKPTTALWTNTHSGIYYGVPVAP